jgi:CxxC motif-containing protein (DUF1111 family)
VGISLAADYLRGWPARAAALVSVELCSLTLQRDDLSVANLISSGLFADGSAAVVLTGAERQGSGPQILATRSVFYPGTERVMGWEISEKGFRIMLSPEVPEVVEQHLAQDVDAFLADQKLTRSDIGSWILHTGGPRILEATQAALGLSNGELGVFKEALNVFLEIDSVKGDLPVESGTGLGPTFNGNSCAQCHAQPAVGGSSPGMKSPQNPVPNPQVALATLRGASNVVPPFITVDGPVREARFITTTGQSSGSLDGGVHGLYTISGRSDAGGCTMAQPDFAGNLAMGNVIFRIPSPVFGLGLVESTPDATLQANLDANQGAKNALGIGGRLNTSGNDGSVTRFGWKAQNKSLVIFAGEAYNVEQGVTTEVFPNERSAGPGCVFNASPEDASHMVSASGSPTGTTVEMAGDSIAFAMFMRLSDPPQPATPTPSARAGQVAFNNVGCGFCHTQTLTTGASRFTGMSNTHYQPHSDFALHHMGSNLADGILQGTAGPDEFRTAPLWGVGQRLFFLHDGRTSDLLAAIQAHASPGEDCVASQNSLQFAANNQTFQPSSRTQSCGSEANAVVAGFNALPKPQQQAILDFLRSL